MGAIDKAAVLTRHRLTVGEYHRMAEAGVLRPDARVELIEGEVIDMAPIGSRHASIVARLARILQRAVADQALVWPQNPVRLGERSEPEPDLVLLVPRDDFYGNAHPGSSDVLLVIEVCDASVRYDREIKLPLYARHGIPEVWIFDLPAGSLDTFREPQADGYRVVTTTATPGVASVQRLPGVSIDLGSIFD